MTVLEVNGVSHGYGDGADHLQALSDVTLSVAAGEVVCVAGPSGSGKTALCHLVAGLETPDAGTVTVAGTPAAEVGDWAQVAVAPQQHGLLAELSVEQNVALPALRSPGGWDGRRSPARRAGPHRAGRPGGRRDLAGRAAAHRDRPGPGAVAAGAGARRADRPPGRRPRRAGAGCCAGRGGRGQCGAGRQPRRAGARGRRPGGPPRRGPLSSTAPRRSTGDRYHFLVPIPCGSWAVRGRPALRQSVTSAGTPRCARCRRPA